MIDELDDIELYTDISLRVRKLIPELRNYESILKKDGKGKKAIEEIERLIKSPHNNEKTQLEILRNRLVDELGTINSILKKEARR